MRAVLADTGPLYAALDPDDDNHERAQEDIERLNLEKLGVIVAYPTLCESYTLILYRLGIAVAHGWLKEIQERASLINQTLRRKITMRPLNVYSDTGIRVSVCSTL